MAGSAFYSTTALDDLLIYTRDNATRVLLLDDYTQGDDYATVTGGSNVLAEATISPADFTGPTSNGLHRLITFTGKSATAGNNSSVAELHIALTNGVNEVLAVTDETSNQTITAGNIVTFPNFYMQSSQPSLV